MLHAEPVDQPETVLLGCLVEEHLRLWRADGRAECVRLRDPADLRALLARGRAPRTPLATRRFREVGRLDGSVLLIGHRPFAIVAIFAFQRDQFLVDKAAHRVAQDLDFFW